MSVDLEWTQDLDKLYGVFMWCGEWPVWPLSKRAKCWAKWHIRLEHPDKSAVAEHSIDQGHRILFHNSSILATRTRYMDRIVREAIEI
jgi:hypothetical protein